MLLAVHRRGQRPPLASDLNETLIAGWRAVLCDPEALHERLLEYEARDSESFYYDVRSRCFADELERAAHFVYVNRTAWNGLYRVNRWGVFNVPWGARRFVPPKLEALLAVSAELKEATVEPLDFRDSLSRVKPGDFLYLDPPYLKISDTSKFNGYTQQRFCADDLAELAELLAKLTENKVRWLLSNRDSELIRGLFPRDDVFALTVRRSVAAQNRRAIEPAASPEVIVSNRSRVAW